VPEENLFALPAGVELRAGAFIEPMAVGLHCLRRAGFRPGQSALVLGAGSIGLLIGLWLKVFSASRVALSDLRAESLATAARLGFTELLDARLAQGAGSSFGQGFEASFEAAGSSAALAAAIEQTRDRGVITVVGRDTADTRLSLASFERLMRKELSLRGCWGYNLSGEEAFLYESLRQGRLPVTPMISHQVPLAEAPALIRAMASREIYFCKALIEL
jgi:threonine dehydrogenase-like Zn-dependent dehydrogenase